MSTLSVTAHLHPSEGAIIGQTRPNPQPTTQLGDPRAKPSLETQLRKRFGSRFLYHNENKMQLSSQAAMPRSSEPPVMIGGQ
jgi:hypothetical protein